VTDLLVREVTVVDLVVETAEAASVAEIAVETAVEVTEVASGAEIAEATKIPFQVYKNPRSICFGDFCFIA
jgi:hypothetical protein